MGGFVELGGSGGGERKELENEEEGKEEGRKGVRKKGTSSKVENDTFHLAQGAN